MSSLSPGALRDATYYVRRPSAARLRGALADRLDAADALLAGREDQVEVEDPGDHGAEDGCEHVDEQEGVGAAEVAAYERRPEAARRVEARARERRQHHHPHAERRAD